MLVHVQQLKGVPEAGVVCLSAPFLAYLAWVLVGVIVCAVIAVQISKWEGRE
jgi:hypothetical protein